MVPSDVTIRAPPKTRAVMNPCSGRNRVMKVKPRKKGRSAELRDMRTESFEVSLIFSMSISKPAKKRRNTIPSLARKSITTREGPSLKKRFSSVGVPSKIPAKIWPTTDGKPAFLNSSPNTKAKIRIMGTITSVSTTYPTAKRYYRV